MSVNVENYKYWAISNQAPNRRRLNDYRKFYIEEVEYIISD
nr:MAG TPA: hypothetical protein [Caudoviricetes sp.]